MLLSLCLIIQQVPGISPTGQFTTIVPLLCILSAAAIKETFEDFVSNKKCFFKKDTASMNYCILNTKQEVSFKKTQPQRTIVT